MVRTQIYLSEEIDAALEQLSKRSGRTKSQLIREALERFYLGTREREDVLRSLRATAGAWRRRVGGKDYEERLRRGRLARLHDRER